MTFFLFYSSRSGSGMLGMECAHAPHRRQRETGKGLCVYKRWRPWNKGRKYSKTFLPSPFCRFSFGSNFFCTEILQHLEYLHENKSITHFDVHLWMAKMSMFLIDIEMTFEGCHSGISWCCWIWLTLSLTMTFLTKWETQLEKSKSEKPRKAYKTMIMWTRGNLHHFYFYFPHRFFSPLCWCVLWQIVN